MCDSDEANVSLLSTWETPVFKTLFCLSLYQFPVERADLRPRVIVSCLIALISKKSSLFECKSFLIWFIISSMNYRKSDL